MSHNLNSLIVLSLLFIFYFFFPQKTFHVPDEYYQSLEIIHHMFHGYGIRSWEWYIGLRSYASVLYYAIVYYIYKYIFHGESVELYLKWSGTIVAMVSLYFGITLWDEKLNHREDVLSAGRRNEKDVAHASRNFKPESVWSKNNRDTKPSKLNSIIITYLPWILTSFVGFWIYVARRSITNSLEMMFTTIALHFFLKKNPNFFLYWFFAGIGCLSRPTNAIVHLYVCIYMLLQRRYSWKEKFRFFRNAFLLTVFWIIFMILVDRYFYKRWIFSIYEFLKFNVLDGNASMYGVHPWHWYFSQGLPLLLLTFLIPFLYIHYKLLRGDINERNSFSIGLIWWTTVWFSLLPHKEFRFLLPVYPLVINVSLLGVRYLLALDREAKIKLSTIMWLAFLIIPNLAFGLFFNTIQQGGAIKVMYFLKDRYLENPSRMESVYFLMPCHHTPGYFYMHTSENAPPKVYLRHLDCSPPKMESDLTRDRFYSNKTLPNGKYLHETALFFDDPHKFTKRLLDNYVPTHIVMYEGIADVLAPFLKSNYDFEEIAKIHHMYFSELLDDNMSNYIKVFERR